MRPADIDPQSGCRLPFPQREEMSEEARIIFDQINDPKGVTLRGLRGPGGIQLHSPRLAVLMRPLNHYLRNQTGFSARVREIAILATARECDNQFEWAAHEDEAVRVGVPLETIEIIRQRGETTGLDATDACVVELARESLTSRSVSPELYAKALGHFGRQQLVDLVVLIGYYAMTAAMLTTFDMQLDECTQPGLPVPAPA